VTERVADPLPVLVGEPVGEFAGCVVPGVQGGEEREIAQVALRTDPGRFGLERGCFGDECCVYVMPDDLTTSKITWPGFGRIRPATRRIPWQRNDTQKPLLHKAFSDRRPERRSPGRPFNP
jgi:hypothetical protein